MELRTMRNCVLPVLIGAAAMLFAGCQKSESDPELTAILKKMADTPASSTGDAGLKAQVEATRDAVRDLKQSQADDLRKLTAELMTKLDSLSKRLSDAEVKLDSTDAAGRSGREALAQMKTDIAAVGAVSNELRTTIGDVASKIRTADPEKLLEAWQKIGEKEREVAAAKAAQETAERKLAEAASKLDANDAEITRLKEDASKAQGADISNHPAMIDLRRKNTELDKNLRDAQRQLDQLKAYIDTLQKGTPAPAPGPGSAAVAGDPWEAGFRAIVTSAVFVPDTSAYNIIADVKEGTAPAIGDVLSVMSEKNEVVCEIRVIRLWDNNGFGGVQIGGKAISPAPTKGDRIVRMKGAVSGAPKDGASGS
jgi:uncharacterized phage infection (PIP) family protein YhgE